MPEQTIDFSGLRKFLLDNPTYFRNEEVEVNPIECVTFWKKRNPKNVVFPGDYFLVDIESNEMWVVQITDKKDKAHLHNKLKKIALLVENCSDIFPRFNGYWKIPEKFITTKDEK